MATPSNNFPLNKNKQLALEPLWVELTDFKGSICKNDIEKMRKRIIYTG